MAESKSRLVIEISAENAKRNADALSEALKEATKSGNDASKSADTLGKYFKNASGSIVDASGKFLSASKVAKQLGVSINDLNTILPEYQKNAKQAGDSSNEFAKSLGGIGDSAKKSTQETALLANSAKKLIGAFAGYLTISEAIQKSDVYTGLQNRLKLVTHSQSELNQAMTDTFKIAQNTHQSWESAAQVYQGFANNAKALGLTMQHTAQITETVSKAIAISGSSAMASEAALVQFNQALSSGALRGEDLNSVLEQAPGLAKAIAQGMGITVGQLRTVAATGAITSEAIVKALDKSKASVDQLFAKTSPTLGQSFTVLSNEVTKFVGETGKASGSAKALADGIQLIANNFNTFATLGISALMGMITAQIVKQTIAIGTSIITWNAETRAVLANNAAKMTALTVGRSLIGVLGGPVGLGVTVAGAAAAYLLMRDSTSQSTQALIENSKYAQQTTADLLKLQGAQKRGAQEDLGKTYGDLAKKMKELSGQYNAQVIDIQNSNKENYQVVEISNKVRQGIISKGEALRELNKIPTVTPDQIDKLSDLYDQYTDTSKTLLDVKGKLDSLKTGIDQSSEAARQAAANQEMYNQKIRDLKKLTDTQNQKTQYQLGNEKLNGSTERGSRWNDFILKFREDNKLSFNQNLTKEQYDIAAKQFDLQEKLKNLQDDNSKAIKEQTKEKERQAVLDLSANEQLARGYQIYQAFLKAGLGKNQALAMAAQVGRENDFNDKYLFGSHTDANNKKTNVGMFSYQGDRATDLIRELRSKDLLNDDGTIKNNQSAIDAQAKFAIREITTNGSYKQTKNALTNESLSQSELSKIIGTNYVRWDYNGNKIGASKAEGAKAKEQNYRNQLANIVNKNGDSSDLDISKLGADEDKLYEIKLQLAEKFYTKDQKLQQDHDKELRDIRLTYTGNEQTEKLKQSESQFQNQKKLNDLQFEQSVNGWAWVGEQKITKDAEVKKAIIDSTIDLTDKQKELAKKGIDDQANYEINTFRKTQALKVQDLQTKINQQLGKAQAGALDTQAKNKLTSSQYESWNLQNQYSDELSTASDDHDKSVRDINKMNDKGDYEIADTQKRQELIMQAHEAYEARKFEITEKYTQKANDLSTAQTSEQLSAYGTMFGGMATLVKGFAGESSGAYKTMLAAQKAANLASAIMSGYTAISAAWGSAPFPANLPAVAAATVKTGVLQAGIEAVSVGFSDGGYTGPGGKHDVAGVVHAGEVVFSQADVARLGGVSAVEGIRKGIKGYSDGGVVGGVSSSISSQLSSNSQQQGDVNIEVNVTGSGTATSGGNTDNQKQLGQMIGNAVRTIIRQEQRQGGLLSK
ncbi:tape measure protein [Acinetobacter pollinis]|uniref:tape measure protein n=1 Tax=Acinetobacter pollinis TaxID=2605270 RepID=UPI0018A2A21F|nr:tape measure protein [Acinetobacter pollinis]MBF7690671.1 tape measure protein [Acinetobacter pollinis]MBF7698605.1 tape measure protein [Acinetobacter pollinis]